ncbi:MAG: transposase [Planctomycetota bacterium]
MARRPRQDVPDSWHHVMNRGLARRSFFETREDHRFFLACVARAVRRGQIEVHAWCILTTHFHLLVRSPKGELSAAMRRVQNAYVRHFNRRRRRDGTLVRGRYLSKPVHSLRYRELLVRYIDANPVRAGLCADPRRYAWCSASDYAAPAGPAWLERSWVERWIVDRAGAPRYEPSLYPDVLDPETRENAATLVDLRLRSRGRGPDELDSLVGMASPEVLAWLRRNAQLADGVAAVPCVAPRAITRAIADLSAQRGSWRLTSGRRSRDAWQVLHAGLLRQLIGENFDTIARRTRVSSSEARRISLRHGRLVREDDDYAEAATLATRIALGRTAAASGQREHHRPS